MKLRFVASPKQDPVSLFEVWCLGFKLYRIPMGTKPCYQIACGFKNFMGFQHGCIYSISKVYC